jgi:hypothetical protein
MNMSCAAPFALRLAASLAIVCAAGTLARATDTPAATALVVAATAPAAAEAKSISELALERAKFEVMIKFINKGDGEDQEVEVPGTMISADGLVLTSNLFFPDGGSPSDMKVLVGDDTQGVDAKFVARDSELGLAWVRIDTKPSEPYAFIDFSKGSTATVGDAIFSVRKMGKYFGQAPIVNEGKVAAVTTKPRTLMIPSNSMYMLGELAVPVYASSGLPVGLTSIISPEDDELGGSGNPFRGFDRGSSMILRASDVAEATTKALENSAAAPDAAEAPNKPTEPAASDTGVQPAGEKKPE